MDFEDAWKRYPRHPETTATSATGEISATETYVTPGGGFKQAFEEVRDRAGIIDLDPRKRLTPHSLGAAAEMAFRKVGLTDKEIDVMKNGVKGHYDVLDDFLEMIHKKLDIAFLGKPLEELEKEAAEYKKNIPAYQQEFENLCEEAFQTGMTKEEAEKTARARMYEKYPDVAKRHATQARLEAFNASLPSTLARPPSSIRQCTPQSDPPSPFHSKGPSQPPAP
jgi:hypothetical protein